MRASTPDEQNHVRSRPRSVITSGRLAPGSLPTFPAMGSIRRGRFWLPSIVSQTFQDKTTAVLHKRGT